MDNTLGKSKQKIEKAIEKMKGVVDRFGISKQTAAVISDIKSVEAMGPYMKQANEKGIQVVPIEFVDAVAAHPDPFSLIK